MKEITKAIKAMDREQELFHLWQRGWKKKKEKGFTLKSRCRKMSSIKLTEKGNLK